jgi:hypothetical protein
MPEVVAEVLEALEGTDVSRLDSKNTNFGNFPTNFI